MKKLLRAVAWWLWLVWPFRRPPAIAPLGNVSELMTLEEWRRQNPQLFGSASAPTIHECQCDIAGVPVERYDVSIEGVSASSPVGSVSPCLRGKPSPLPPRVPLSAARQYALEMLGLRKWTRKQPFAIGGVVVQTARVRVFEATRSETGEELAREVRQLRIVYPDGRDEQIEFFADGRLYFHAKG